MPAFMALVTLLAKLWKLVWALAAAPAEPLVIAALTSFMCDFTVAAEAAMSLPHCVRMAFMSAMAARRIGPEPYLAIFLRSSIMRPDWPAMPPRVSFRPSWSWGKSLNAMWVMVWRTFCSALSKFRALTKVSALTLPWRPRYFDRPGNWFSTWRMSLSVAP